jgi:hypothetical protein
MEHKSYNPKNLQKPSFFQKILGQKIKENAIIEVNNLLAEKDFKQVQIEDIHKIELAYGISFAVDFENELQGFYKSYLKSCLEDKFISESELQDLRDLKRVLGLNDRQISVIHKELAGQIYKAEVEKVIQDGELDEDERLFIEKLQSDLKLSNDIAGSIYKQSGQELIQQFMHNAIADARLTPEEEAQMKAIAKNLNVDLIEDENTKSDLEKYKLYWRIENEDMTEIPNDLGLPKNEKCYFMAEIQWYEKLLKPNKAQNNEHLRLKIAKGIYWRKMGENAKDLSDWTILDTGKLYLTNKRIIFKGKTSEKITLLNRILDFQVYDNGIDVDKEGDKDPFFKMEKTADIFAMLLGKSISQMKG